MATVRVTTWAMATVTKGARDEEDNGNSGKSNGNGCKGGEQATATRAMATATVTTWAMATAMRLAGNKEGKAKGGKGNSDSNEGGMQQRG